AAQSDSESVVTVEERLIDTTRREINVGVKLHRNVRPGVGAVVIGRTWTRDTKVVETVIITQTITCGHEAHVASAAQGSAAARGAGIEIQRTAGNSAQRPGELAILSLALVAIIRAVIALELFVRPIIGV